VDVDYILAKTTTVYVYYANLTASADLLADDLEQKTVGIGFDNKF